MHTTRLRRPSRAFAPHVGLHRAARSAAGLLAAGLLVLGCGGGNGDLDGSVDGSLNIVPVDIETAAATTVTAGEIINVTCLLVDAMGELITASWTSSAQGIIERCLDQSPDYDALPEDQQPEVLLALLHLEVELRRKLGQSPSSCEYATRFPHLDRETIDDMISLPAVRPTQVANADQLRPRINQPTSNE